jgi:hypothetical protein
MWLKGHRSDNLSHVASPTFFAATPLSTAGYQDFMSKLAQGSFDIVATREPPYDSADGLVLARTSFAKTFQGDLEASSTVQMLSAAGPVKGSAVYVALERVHGKLGGLSGNFVLAHYGVMNRGAPTLLLAVAPDSGTGELSGLSGQMQIEIKEGGQHFYRFEYELPGPSVH